MEQPAHDGDVGARLAGRFGGLPVPLQHASAVDQGAILLGEAGGGQAEHRGLDAGGVDVVVLAGVAPELRGLGGQRVHDHQVLELGEAGGDLGLVGEGADGVEALAEVAVDLAVVHQVEHLEHVVAGDIQLGQPVVAPVVLDGGRLAEPGLHQADVELAVVLPIGHLPRPHRFAGALVDVGGVVLFGVARQGQVARQQVGQQAEVGQALDVGVAAQGVHPAAGHADVAQQQLHHGAGADHLRAHRMLGPAQGIHDGHDPGRVGRFGDQAVDLLQQRLRRTADAADQIRRVAAVVLLHQLEYAARVLQGRVGTHIAVVARGVAPGGLVRVGALGLVVAAEQAVLEAVPLVHDEGGVGVVAHVLVLDLVVADQVVDQAAEEGDIGAGADRRVVVGHGGRAGEARIDHDQAGVVVRLGFGDPLEAAGVGFGGVAAHDQHQIGILDVGPVVRHGSTAKRRGKTCHRRAMSDTRLVIEPQHAEGTHHLVGDVAGLVGGRRRREEPRGEPAVDCLALVILRDEVGVAVGLHQLGDAVEGVIPFDALPRVGAGFADLRVLEAVGAVDEVQEARAFRAEGAAVDRVVRVALDMDDVLRDVLRRIALAVHDQAAADRAVRTGVARLDGTRQLEVPDLVGEGIRGCYPQGRQARSSKAHGTDLEELSTVHVHRVFPHQAGPAQYMAAQVYPVRG
ncbi:hypothetical protein D3C84_399080 [compost metagenome]